jgi:hypothetical protein
MMSVITGSRIGPGTGNAWVALLLCPMSLMTYFRISFIVLGLFVLLVTGPVTLTNANADLLWLSLLGPSKVTLLFPAGLLEFMVCSILFLAESSSVSNYRTEEIYR